MQIIRHRVNTVEELKAVRPEWGAEIDLRSDVNRPGRLHLAHDPWILGGDFEEWAFAAVKQNIRGPIILNTKEDGLETCALDILSRAGLKNFFFLDTQIPTLVKLGGKIEASFAVRLSRYEPRELASQFEGKARWVWVDCFDGIPMEAARLAPLVGKFKICLVSPELQGKPVETIPEFRSLLAHADAVCTKVPDRWTALNP